MQLRTTTRCSVAAVLAITVAACGGGGGGGDGAATVPPPGGVGIAGARLLPWYRFTLSDTGTESDRLVAAADFEGTGPIDVVVDSRIEPTLGEYDFTTRTVTFTSGAVAAESDFGAMVVDILGPISLAPGAVPDGVSLEITMSLEGLVRLKFAAGMVDLQRVSGPVTTMTIEEFEGLLADRFAVPVWQHQSALGWAVLDLLRHLVVLTADALDLVDTGLQSLGSADRVCDLLPGAPPAGLLNQGMSRLTWLGAGSITTGHDFAWDHTGCWLAGSDGRGVVLDGRVDLRGLVGTVAAGELTRVGFQTVSELGGVLFPDSGITGTVTTISSTATTGSTVTLKRERSFVLRNGIRLTFEAP